MTATALNIERMSPEDLTALIDPNLRFVKDFGKSLSTAVYRVESEHGPAVLKIGFNDSDIRLGPGVLDHIKQEKAALEVLDGVKGIPKLYTSYYKDDKDGKFLYLAVLKEYIEGISLKDTPEARRITKSPVFEAKMSDLIKDINNRGVILREGPHEFCYTNIIVAPDFQPYFIDLGYAMMPNSIDVKRDKLSVLKWLLQTQYDQFKEAYFPVEAIK